MSSHIGRSAGLMNFDDEKHELASFSNDFFTQSFQKLQIAFKILSFKQSLGRIQIYSFVGEVVDWEILLCHSRQC